MALSERLTRAQEILGHEFNNKVLLRAALTHPSAVEGLPVSASYERLEFLGDSILGFVVAEYLYRNFPDKPEGELTRLRSYAVCEKSLFEYAKEINLGDRLLLGKGEEMTGGRTRPSVVSDAFEAVIAAIYIDGGIGEAKKFVLRFVEPYVEAKPSFKDYKTILQEVVQKNQGESLKYVLVSESGPDHDKHFKVEVHLNSNVIGAGVGSSKKKAEQAAAKEALELMGI